MQTVFALAIVGICAAYVVRSFVRTFANPESAGCHCSGCPSAKVEPCNSEDRMPRSTARNSGRHSEA